MHQYILDNWAYLALAYPGYKDGFNKCAEIADSVFVKNGESKLGECSIDELRTALFFEQRRWRHYGANPDQDAMNYISSLIEVIRSKSTDQSLINEIDEYKKPFINSAS